jgi:hypothetical protein
MADKIESRIDQREDLKAVKIRDLDDGAEVWRCELLQESKSPWSGLPFYAICMRGMEVHTSKPGTANRADGLQRALKAYAKLGIMR